MWVVLLALLGGAVRVSTSHRRVQIMRDVEERVGGASRFVDIGVTLHTVVHDPNGKKYVKDKPSLRIIRTRHFGGIADTHADPPTFKPGSRNPQVWYCSEDQEAALLHDDYKYLSQLIHGSMGAGKTRLLCMWHYMRWLEHFGDRREAGQTAPTLNRLGLVRLEMQSMYPRSWGRYVARDEFEGFEMCDGTGIRFRYTHQQSAAKGSPIQGYNWSWCGRDEMQDQGPTAHEDIEDRGRSARTVIVDGKEIVAYKQLATATGKDDSAWRELRDRLGSSGVWLRRDLSIFRTPFVGKDFIAKKMATYSPREFMRRYGDPKTGKVVDLPPELAVYYGWLRDRNLVPIPRVVTDVTAAILGGYKSYCRPGAGFTLLAMHDPGAIYNTTEIVRLLMFGDVPTWCVVGELQTEQTTAREHAIALKTKLQQDFGVDWDATRNNPSPSGGKACIFVDPHGKGEGDTDYQTTYMAFQSVGLDVFNPAPMTGKIRRGPRIEMVNRLLGGTMEDEVSHREPARLVVCTDVYGNVLAPKLVEAFESLKKDPGAKEMEGKPKGQERDKTHAPAALAYGLWPFEQEAFTRDTVKRALAEVQRMRRS